MPVVRLNRYFPFMLFLLNSQHYIEYSNMSSVLFDLYYIYFYRKLVTKINVNTSFIL